VAIILCVYFKDFSLIVLKNKKKIDKMTLDLHFTLKVSADLL
jgi:hypothetical protein